MRENMQSVAKEYTKRNHWRKIWRRIAGGLACVVVFCTIYALMLPALTLESETICGLEEHTHTEECYRQITSEQVSVLNCKMEAHSHGEECYDAEGKLLCGQVNYVLHTHTEVCSVDGELVCQLPEVKEHSHGDGCWETRKAAPVLVCENAEEDHVHGDECYAVPLSCDIPVSEEHNHEDACYQTETVLVCTVPEIKAHSHSAECEGGCDMIEVAAHVHGEDCFETQEIPVDTETLTCQIPEEEHTHGPMCYGTWVLECQLEEHTHTENCEPKQELTEEELAQVDAVIQQIDTLETTEQVEAKLTEYEAAEDWEGYETYREEAAQKIQAVRDSYNALSDAQKQKVTNAAKLTQLDWLVPMATLEEEENGNTGTIEEWLNGDWAYINSLKVVSRTTGTKEWDADDKPGNDSSADNDILRTFDVATYTLRFTTALRDEVANLDVGGIKFGRVYFQFILPVSMNEAQFDGGFYLADGVKYTVDHITIDGVPSQVLRGSYILKPMGDNVVSINGEYSLNVNIRALRMHNGDTIQPSFTMWLQHNDVGAEYSADGTIPTTIVKGDHICSEPKLNKDNVTYMEPHMQQEAAICEDVPVITISARTMLNIAVVKANSVNIGTGSFDLGEGDLEGRIFGVGLRIELRGKPGQAMRGVEFPEEDQTLSFELDMSSTYDPAGSSKGPQYEPAYQVQFWTGGGNYRDSDAAVSADTEINGSYNQTGREVAVYVGSDRIAALPVNWKLDGVYSYRSCYDGGEWKFEPIADEPGKFKVTVSDFTVMPVADPDNDSIDAKKLQKTGYFPETYVTGNENSKIYYDPDQIGNYWDLQYAVFSAGELWLVQPHEAFDASGNKIHITEVHGDDPDVNYQGQFNTHVDISETINVSWEQKPVEQMEPDTETCDNEVNMGIYLKRPGSIDGKVCLLKKDTRVWNNTLTDGCELTDEDWATNGSGVTLISYLIHDGAEGDFTGVAYNDLLKFDDRFFAPDPDKDPDNESNKNVEVHSNGVAMHKQLWGALPEGGGWPSEKAMKEATPDDLIFFNKLEDMEKAAKEDGINYVPVATMLETRGVSKTTENNHFLQFVDGTVKGEPGEVYMITRCSYAWAKKDVAEEALKFHNDKYPDNEYEGVSELTDEDYNAYVQYELDDNAYDANSNLVGFPSRLRTTKQVFKTGSHEERVELTGDYPKPFWRQDYYYAQEKGAINSDGNQKNTTTKLSECRKAEYKNGVYIPGDGAWHYQDSCLVIPFKTQITKTTAQESSQTDNAKKIYDVSANERTVVYKLSPSVVREGAGSKLNTTVYVEDVLPAGLTYEPKSSCLGGEYDQDSGTVTGGTPFVSNMTATKNEDGTTTLRWWFNVSLDTETTYWSKPIYYVCSIGNAGADDDVKHDQQLVNSVKIWATGTDTSTNADDDDCRPFSAMHGNVDTYSILIQKTSAVSLAKISDYLVVDKGEDFGFTMTVGNNSGEAKKNTVIMESLPINGWKGTHFNGQLVVSEFTAELVNAGEDKLADKLTFYYTTSEEFAGKLSSYILKKAKDDSKTVTDWLAANSGTWQSLEFGASAEEGKLGYTATLPSVTEQITAIVAVGELPANATLKMHITIQLPEGEAKDYLVNYLSQDESLTSYARAQMVNRTLQGLTWLDSDRDGVQDSSEEKISGVKVSLLKLNEGLKSVDNYVPVCYPGTQTPIQIQTGQTISFLAEAGTTPTSYNEGCYQFTDLPAGTYAVEFTDIDPDKDPIIANLVASPVDNVTDDTKDSDGVPTYSSDKKRLEKTRIEGIVMPEAHKLTYGEHVSRYHDSGFYYRDVELPSTGGMGTILFYVIGGPLTLAAGAVLCRKKRKEKGSSES